MKLLQKFKLWYIIPIVLTILALLFLGINLGNTPSKLDEISGTPCTDSNNPCPVDYMCSKINSSPKSIGCDEVECICRKLCDSDNDCPKSEPTCLPKQIIGAIGICVK